MSTLLLLATALLLFAGLQTIASHLGDPPDEALVLHLLGELGESYGLDLVRESGGRLKRGSIYVTLSRLEDLGLVTSREEPAPGLYPGQLPRRLYSLVRSPAAA